MGVTNGRGKSLVGLITGILGACGLTSFAMGMASEYDEPVSWFGAIACGLLVFGSVYVAWKRPGIGGVMLITSSVVVSVVNSILDFQSGAKWAGFSTMFLGIPSGVVLLISGILFLLLWRRQQKQRSLETS